MGNTVSRGTLDVIYILFPFVLSAGLIIMVSTHPPHRKRSHINFLRIYILILTLTQIVVCWWKCKLFVNRRRPAKSRREDYAEESNFGHLINIQGLP